MAEFSPKISYTARDFETIKAELEAFVKETRPDAWSDFFESNLGVTLIELAALVGDMLSYGQDIIAQEMFLATCRRYESALRFARSVGYVPRAASAAEVTVKSLTHPESLVTFGGVIPAGATIRGQNGLTYELLEDFPIAVGDTVSRVTLKEGTSYEETFEPTNKQLQEVFVSNGIVEEGSWKVYVGDPSVGTNLWSEVENIQFETSPGKVYDTYLDGNGRLHIRFGDGAAGLIPDDIITVKYRTTNGARGNSPVSSIRGALRVNLTAPGVGVVSVEYENKDTDAAATGTELVSSEPQGTTFASQFASGTLQKTPVVAATVVLLITPQAGGALVLKDNGAGSFDVISNTTPHALVNSAITYSTGAWQIEVTPNFAVNGSMFADYFYIKPISVTSLAITGAASGGADRESLEELRVNIPAYIRSQDRILTLEDYNDVILQVPGIALVFSDTWISSYTANIIKVHVWDAEEVDFVSTSDDGSASIIKYNRYLQVEQDRVSDIQAFIKPRTVVTVHNVILRPLMLWVDIYLGDVRYDKRFEKKEVHAAITQNIVNVFQNASGFAIRLSEIYNAVRDASGVGYFTLQRIATGNQAYSDELQGQTDGTAVVAGNLLEKIVSPKTVVITVEQTDTTQIILRDNGFGQFTTTNATILSSSIDYITGAWTVTFDQNLIPNQRILASYHDIKNDYRHDQIVTVNTSENGDVFPPPNATVSAPVATPPYRDGLPLFKNGTAWTPAMTYADGDTLTYDKLIDIVIKAVALTAHFYDETYQFNNEIYYDSVIDIRTDIRAINLRKLHFNLIAE